MRTINIGIVGAAGRGGSFRLGCEATGVLRIHAVCDVRADALEAAGEVLGARETYTDYDEMLERSDIQAVIVGTPMHLHVPQSIAALRRNLHVLCEVPAAVSTEEARELVLAVKASRGVFMMAENYTYMRSNAIVRELARQGLFGELYYAEGEYLHELKGLNERTTWRRRWQTGVDGISYGTHSLGPILQWFSGQRVVSVSSVGSGHHYRDPRGEEYENQDSCLMLCRMSGGGLAKIRVDMLSERPHAMTNYQLQGTDGCYESSRGGPWDRDKIWLRALSPRQEWIDLASLLTIQDLAERYVPEIWRDPPEGARRAGHGGGDYFEIMDFVEAIQGKRPCVIGIHEAMDMTLPGLVSQASIQRGGEWLEVPDSRSW